MFYIEQIKTLKRIFNVFFLINQNTNSKMNKNDGYSHQSEHTLLPK
jgi:hypothetical protein